MIRLRPLTEAECYARCYGGWEPTVRIVRLEPRRPRYPARVSGEELRRLFEERIDSRDGAGIGDELGPGPEFLTPEAA